MNTLRDKTYQVIMKRISFGSAFSTAPSRISTWTGLPQSRQGASQ